MFDWLYKQANLQSMCSITSQAMPPEYQHDSAKLGRRGWASCSPPAGKGHGLGALAGREPRLGGGRAAARGTCGLLGSLRGSSAAGGLQAPASGGTEKTSFRQVRGSGVKASCGIKDEALPCCTGMTRMRHSIHLTRPTTCPALCLLVRRHSPCLHQTQ